MNTRQKTAGEEGWKVYTEITSEKLTPGKRETHFLSGARILTFRGHIASTPILTSVKEENYAFPEKRIKTNKKAQCDWSESNPKATMKIRHSCEFFSELGMGRKGQLSPISLVRAVMLLLSWTAT